MSVISKSPRILLLLAMLTGTASASLAAQQQDPSDADISAAVYSSPSPEAAEMAEGPEIEGIISARSGDGMQVTTADGTNTVIDRKSVVKGKSGSVRVDLGGRRTIKKQKKTKTN